ncbi:MAG TPA: hypothetical protein VL263_27140 [Vicinamibacterales bacterium]|nr:hypothetical protein [Vicinamibacterales bacterium]
MADRTYRAGQSVEDHCRQCHEDRMHTVIVVDAMFQPIRVRCDYCSSEHNYRGGPRTAARSASASGAQPTDGSRPIPDSRLPASAVAKAAAVPLVSPNERRFPAMSHDASTSDLETLIRTIIREESGLTAVTPADKWRGGEIVLRPGKTGLQEKTWPIETFFHKVVMLRNRLRTLEQQVNASELPDDQKVKLQAYITGCYGSLTSFNILFADEGDKFVGSGD